VIKMWIDDECKKLRNRLSELHRYKDLMIINENDWNHKPAVIFKLYIQYKSAAKVAEIVRPHIKTEKGHSFQNKHVNELLNKKLSELDIDLELYNAVKKIRNMNKKNKS